MRGRNSLPRCVAIGRHEIAASAAVTSVKVGRASAKCTIGRYARTRTAVSGLRNSGTMRPRNSRSRSAGASVSVTSAPASTTSVLLSASGRKSRPVSPPNANTGTNASAAISNEVRIAGTSAPAASTRRRRRSPSPPPRWASRRRWQASSATRSASTAMPSAIAIPPRLMTVAGTPNSRNAANVSSTMNGSVTIGNQRACRMQQEQQDHEGDHHDLLGHRAHQRVLDPAGQLGAIVEHVDLVSFAAGGAGAARSPP